jgi:anaerobic dimethyl sulfoxide reductase subunit B (iron-sulfur subunit)
LENGESPICVMSCPARALDFGPLDEMKAKYGDMIALEDMPDGAMVKPGIVFKPMNERKQVVPFDTQRALELLQDRGPDLPPQFDSIEGLKDLGEGLIGYSKLVMKAASVQEALALSKNEEG